MLKVGSPCPECRGTLIHEASAGRTVKYCGQEKIIPADMIIPTCNLCGDRWMDSQMVRALQKYFESDEIA